MRHTLRIPLALAVIALSGLQLAHAGPSLGQRDASPLEEKRQDVLSAATQVSSEVQQNLEAFMEKVAPLLLPELVFERFVELTLVGEDERAAAKEQLMMSIHVNTASPSFNQTANELMSSFAKVKVRIAFATVYTNQTFHVLHAILDGRFGEAILASQFELRPAEAPLAMSAKDVEAIMAAYEQQVDQLNADQVKAYRRATLFSAGGAVFASTAVAALATAGKDIVQALGKPSDYKDVPPEELRDFANEFREVVKALRGSIKADSKIVLPAGKRVVEDLKRLQSGVSAVDEAIEALGN